MRKQITLLSMVLLVGLTAGCYAEPADNAANETGDTTPTPNLAMMKRLAVETATRAFYAALNRLFAGDTASMDQVWWHTDDVTSMGPQGGIATGWPEVQALFAEAAQLKVGGKFEPDDLHTTVGAELALVECYEVGRYVSPNGGALPVRIRATNSFRKENGQWKMIGHHTDLVPTLAGGTSSAASSANLSDPGDPADSDSIEVKNDEVLLKLEE